MEKMTRYPFRWVSLGMVAMVGMACGNDREKLRKEAREELQADFDKRVKEEVDRRLLAELPRQEARIRSELTGKKLPSEAKEPGTGTPRPAEMPPAREPGRDAGVMQGGEPAQVTGPPAVPLGTVEAKAPEVDPQGLVVSRVLLAKALVERKPEGEGTAFSLADERVYCYIDAKNPKGPERKLTVVWHHNGKVFHRLGLRVGVGHVWRTWAYLSIKPGHAGNWRCGVFNEEGQLIQGVGFTISK